MRNASAIVTGSAAVTPASSSIGENCDFLGSGRTVFSEPTHFDAHGLKLGVDHTLDGGSGSRAFRLMEKLRSTIRFEIPADTKLFFSTTCGAIDLLEAGDETDTSAALFGFAKKIFGISSGCLVSAACASGQTAVSLAMEQLNAGLCTSAFVVGCDIVSEFVHTGFSALGAVSREICRPYDAARSGLTLGEAASALLLRPQTCNDGIGRIIRAAETCDACHITAPDLDGKMLKDAILETVGNDPVGGIIGHGTGTVYNDQAEINALRAVFPETPPPLFSLKGNFGHTLGATGVLQIALGLELSRRRILPPQAGLRSPMPGANVSGEIRRLANPTILSLNVGFGGLNSAVLLEAI